MATATASSFNSAIGGLRQRGNNDAQFQKAMNDRMTMLKYDAPSALEGKVADKEAQMGGTMGGFKGIADLSDTATKIKASYNKVKSSADAVVSKVGELGDKVGQASGAVPQQGIRSLATDALTKVKMKVKQSTTQGSDTASQPVSGATATATDVKSGADATANAGKAVSVPSGSGYTGGSAGGGAGAGVADTDKAVGAVARGGGGGISEGITPANVGKFIPPEALSGGMSGDSTIARATAGRSRNIVNSVGGGGGERTNPMNVKTMTSVDQTSNSTLSATMNDAKSAIGGMTRNATGANAPTSSNIHSNISQALEDFKGQVSGAMTDVQSHISNLSGQVADVGKGVMATGADIANVGSKAVAGVSAGLETAGAVADALGPIGDLVGLGMAIYGGIEGHREHAEDQTANIVAQGHLSTPLAGQTQQTTNVSLDTSKAVQPTLMGHF